MTKRYHNDSGRNQEAQALPAGDSIVEIAAISESTFEIHTSRLFDSKFKTFLQNITLVVDPKTGLISDTYQHNPLARLNTSPPNIDLRHKTVLPGLVDAHTHIFLHAHSEVSAMNQERDESLVERVIRATNHCRAALKAGYTTYRDLGTEGAADADIGVRDAVNRGLIPGPRLFVATDPLASSGGYAIRFENRLGGVAVPRLSDPCDGVDGCTAGVRRRIGAGADVIKFYADYRRRTLRYPSDQGWPGCSPILHPPSGNVLTSLRNPNSVLFSQEEMDAMVAEAKRAGAPVAAHAGTAEAQIMAAKAGVTTIEHGNMPSKEALKVMREKGTIFVPTLSVMEYYKQEVDEEWFQGVLANAKLAWDMGVKLACGGDTGAVAHGDNARELELMVKAGIPLEEVLQAATLGGWEACGAELCGKRFGSLEKGWSADLVAVDSSLSAGNIESVIRNVSFVMKDGKAFVVDGKLIAE